MTTGERIRALRKSSRMSQLELAQKTGYTDRSSIAKIEANRAELTETKIKAFAEVFGITPAELLGITETPEEFPPPVIADNIVKIPILGEIAAGYDAEDYEDYSIGNMEIPPAWLLGPKFTPLEPVLNGLQEPKKRPRCHHRGPNRRNNMEMIYVFNFSLSMFHTAQIAAESAAATTGASTFHAEEMSGGNPLLSMMHTSGTSTPKKL